MINSTVGFSWWPWISFWFVHAGWKFLILSRLQDCQAWRMRYSTAWNKSPKVVWHVFYFLSSCRQCLTSSCSQTYSCQLPHASATSAIFATWRFSISIFFIWCHLPADIWWQHLQGSFLAQGSATHPMGDLGVHQPSQASIWTIVGRKQASIMNIPWHSYLSITLTCPVRTSSAWGSSTLFQAFLATRVPIIMASTHYGMEPDILSWL